MRDVIDTRVVGDRGGVLDHEVEFAEFCAAAHGPLVAALAHHTGDRWLAEELAQESLLAAAANWRRVRTLAAPVGWCFRVGCNKAASHFRRLQAERRAHRRRATYHDVATGPDVTDALAVRQALSALPHKGRQLLLLRYFLGLSVTETAEALGMTAVAVRVGSHRAVSLMRDHFELTRSEGADRG